MQLYHRTKKDPKTLPIATLTVKFDSVIMASENMINYSLKFIRPVLCGHVSTFEVKESAEVAWTSEVQQRLNSTVFNNGGCMSWYQSQETGWNATVYP